MENDITANPDYQLIMSFLKSIRPGDMSDEAATQLKMIGERIQSGGSLSDQEREMFQSVMGAVSDSMGAVSDAEMQMYKDNLPRPRPSPNMGAVSDAEMQMMPHRVAIWPPVRRRRNANDAKRSAVQSRRTELSGKGIPQ
jgi:hypothetical protein